MAYAALDAIDDAIDATKAFLLPFEFRKWLRLAVIMIFVAGGGGGGANWASNAPQFADGGTGGQAPTDPGMALPDAAVGGLVIAIVGIVLLLVLALLVVSPIMEFVFVESLFDREVHIRRYFSQNIGNGLRLLGFNLAIGIVGLLLIGIPFALLLLGVIGGSETVAVAGTFLLLIPVIFLYALVSGLITGLTNVFVVPVMLAEDRGLLSAWGRVWSAMTDDIAEFLVYIVISVILGIGVGIVAAFGAVFVLAVIGIPFGLVGFAIVSVGGTNLATLAVIAVLGIVAFVLFLLGTGLVQAPLQSFLRYYALLVLGDIAADLDPIPEIRAEIRGDAVGDATDDAATDGWE